MMINNAEKLYIEHSKYNTLDLLFIALYFIFLIRGMFGTMC